jgi:hypothetical protein
VPWDHSQFWSGAGGVIAAAVVSSLITLFVLFRQRRNDRQLTRDSRSEDGARRITEALIEAHAVAKELLGQKTQVAPGQWATLDRAIRSMATVTKLDIPLLTSPLMRRRVYYTRKSLEELSPQIKSAIGRIEKDLGRGLITDDEAYQEWLEVGARLASAASAHLGILIQDLDEFRALGREPRRHSDNPPVIDDTMAIVKWSLNVKVLSVPWVRKRVLKAAGALANRSRSAAWLLNRSARIRSALRAVSGAEPWQHYQVAQIRTPSIWPDSGSATRSGETPAAGEPEARAPASSSTASGETLHVDDTSKARWRPWRALIPLMRRSGTVQFGNGWQTSRWRWHHR